MRYHCIHVLCVLTAVPLGNIAKPLSPLAGWGPMHIKHSWSPVPDDWVSLGHPPPGTTIDLYIALKSHRENALRDTLYQVSEPSHPRPRRRYGAHLTNEQLAELIAPHPETLELVNSWLVHQGIPSSSISMTHGGDTLTLKDVSIIQANALLNASYQLYRHVEHGGTIIRTVGYALPVGLHKHVVTVAPTTTFFSLPPPTQWHASLNGSDGEAVEMVRAASGEPATQLSNRAKVSSLEPSFLRWLYGTATYKPAAIDRNFLGIAGFLNDYPSPTDLKAFMRKYRSDGKKATFTVMRVNNGGYDPKRPAIEANLDLQYAMAMAYPTPHIFYSTGQGRSNTDDWFISFLGYFLRQQNGPKTISTSYCVNEKSSSLEYSIYVCDLFGKLGLLGVSVLYATCDDGVGKDCTLSDGTVRFKPKFPATCPYVTAVGGTTDFDPEVGAVISGGGFSDYFKIPDYQRQAVPGFFQILGNKYNGLYNATGRGIPDISAQAMGFNIFVGGKKQMVHGTSGSAPVVAGIIALINDHLISNNRPVLGFLNPWLYGSAARSLFDVTSGTNPGCNTDGFSAVPGWDPVTGLGTLVGVFPGLSGLGSSSRGLPP
ncbi:subtilisin-like protein [Lactarius akahatsu]|uniref:tripeptidyl-peptidase II n=1 Tax=Lactarius akahatsu TaxID=416441 RepID=A0AAD4LC35_9AGAM|nr:subtilisin-like protein [Lactarius akahatsu]